MNEEVRTYSGGSLAEALAAVKADLGRDATILRTRKTRRGGILGLFGREVVEITARASSAPLGVDRGAGVGVREAAAAIRGLASRGATGPVRESASLVAPEGDEDPLERDRRAREDRVRRELTEIKTLAHDLVRHSKEHQLSHLPEGFFAWYRRLVDLGVSEGVAQELVSGLASEWRGKPNPTRQELLEPLLERFLAALRKNGPISLRDGKQVRVVLVGPPGSGKSTTVAKLASHFALQQGVSVGLVSLDTHRVGAAEQISAYARMLNVPLVVAKEPVELESRLADLHSRRLLLIDTQGLASSDRPGFDRMAGLLRVLEGGEPQLVLPATASLAAQEVSIRTFRALRPRSLIVTKLDEAVTGWGILEVVRAFGGGLSYLTFGQGVPEDIVPAELEMIGRVLRAIGGME